MAMPTEFLDTTEPFHDVDAEALAAGQLYGVMSGCALTYDAANLTVDIAAGVVMHNGLPVAVAAATDAVTLVADATNPRWSWIGVNSSGTGVLISGTPAATPAKPEYSTDIVPLGLVRVPAGETIAANIPAANRLDKRQTVRYLGHKGTDIASAATLVTPAGGGTVFHVTGTTTITALPAGYGAGNLVVFIFDGALTLTHNATSLILPGAANITTAAGDMAICFNEGSNNWRVIAYTVAANSPVVAGTTIVVKVADETVNNSSTLQNDDDFVTASLSASSEYFVELFLNLLDNFAGANLKYAWDIPADATIRAQGVGGGDAAELNASAVTAQTADATGVRVNTSVAGEHSIYIWATITIVTAGAAQLQWAQNTAQVGDLTVRADSVMRYQKKT